MSESDLVNEASDIESVISSDITFRDAKTDDKLNVYFYRDIVKYTKVSFVFYTVFSVLFFIANVFVAIDETKLFENVPDNEEHVNVIGGYALLRAGFLFLSWFLDT